MLCDPAPFFGPPERAAGARLETSPWARFGEPTLVWDAPSDGPLYRAQVLLQYPESAQLVPVARLPPLGPGARLTFASPIDEATLTHLALDLAVGGDEAHAWVRCVRSLEGDVQAEREWRVLRGLLGLHNVADSCLWLCFDKASAAPGGVDEGLARAHGLTLFRPGPG